MTQTNKYTIIFTRFQHGQMIQSVNKDQVRCECEKLKHASKLEDNEEVYIRIEVVNNDTGEVREFWNNHENEIKF